MRKWTKNVSVIKWLIAGCVIILPAVASSILMGSFVFFTNFNFCSAFITCNNLLLGNHFEIFCFSLRFVIRWIKIVARRILYRGKKSVGLICATSNQEIRNLYLIFQLPRRNVHLLESQNQSVAFTEILNDFINWQLIGGGSNLALYGVNWNISLWISPISMLNPYRGDTGNTLNKHRRFQF